MVGKFLAGLLATCVIFVTSELLQNIAFVWHLSPGVRDLYLYNNHGMEHAAVYLGVTVLACVGYGAFFLVAGMLFKNPILPTAGILIWEMAQPILARAAEAIQRDLLPQSAMPGEYSLSAGNASAPRLADLQPRPCIRSDCSIRPADRRPDCALRLESSSPAYGNQLHHRITADGASLELRLKQTFAGRYSIPPPIGTSTN